jgi:hypothetical protein
MDLKSKRWKCRGGGGSAYLGGVEARFGIDAVKGWGFVEAFAEGSVGVDGLS